MPSQQVEIAETIAAVKRALKRQREAPSDQPITAASNRGNKLKGGAQNVHEGSLTYMHGPVAYKQKIEHAGFTRYILERNPRRYNEYGDELEDSESDEEADADAADENAYSGIHLEELLCPLKYPAELPVHPTMSHPYLSDALPNMVMATQDKLRQEKANLWRAKHLNRQLIGDESWVPCEIIETHDDLDIFEPRKAIQTNGTKKRKREDNSLASPHVESADTTSLAQKIDAMVDNAVEQGAIEASSGLNNHETGIDEDVNMADPDHEEVDRNKEEHDSGIDSPSNPEPTEKPKEGDSAEGPDAERTASALNGINHVEAQQAGEVEEHNGEKSADPPVGSDLTAQAEPVIEEAGENKSKSPSEADEASPAPPPRRITRALAANNNSGSHSSAASPPPSPTPTLTSSSTSSLLQIDPLFLLPPSAHPANLASAFHGLPTEEALETRRLLTTYIQKQEESVRGYEAVLAKLLKAQRLRDEVLEMCKADGHVGEMSDGEDWIDYEQWGLQAGELRKGRDEDEDAMEENTIGGRKGKRRARN